METDVSTEDLASSQIADPTLRDDVAGILRDGPEVTIVSQITSRSLLLAVIPLLILGTITAVSFFVLNSNASDRLDESRDQLIDESIGAHLEEEAELLLTRLDAVVSERFDDVIDWSRADIVVEAAMASWPVADRLGALSVDAAEAQAPAGGLLDTSGATSDFLSAQTADRPIFAEVFFTDANGFNIGATNPTTDFVQRDEIWWQAAWNSRAYLGELEFDESAGVASFEISVRIDDPETQLPVGVIKAVVDASVVQNFATEFSAAEGEDVQVTVINLDGLILAETETNHNRNRLANPDVALTDDRLTAFSRARVDSDDDGFYALEELVVGFARTEDSRFVERLRAEIPNHNWVIMVEQPSEVALAPLSGVEEVRSDVGTLARNLTVLIVLVIAVAVIATYYVSRIVAGRITDPINSLRDEAHRVADEELPELVESLRDPDSTVQAPEVHAIDIDADGEVAELAEAFNSVRATAVSLAAEQAIARRQVTNMLRNLGRRNQQLIGRQLEFIDDLEQRESDPDILENLFRLDSLASRMRRNAESLVVLAGDSELRTGGAPTAIEDVIRGAISEVEDYERVQITAAEPAIVQGHVVNDLTHLLAEVIENATNFSPPGTPVAVIGSGGLDGSYSISVVDQGLGMSRRKMVEANARIRRPNITDDPESSYLGLYVIGRLAARHNIDARLVESATEGVTAKLTLPASCLIGPKLAEPPAPAEDAPAVAEETAGSAADSGLPEVDLSSLTPRVRRARSGDAHSQPQADSHEHIEALPQQALASEPGAGVSGELEVASSPGATPASAWTNFTVKGSDSDGGPVDSGEVGTDDLIDEELDPSSHPDSSAAESVPTSLELPESWLIAGGDSSDGDDLASVNGRLGDLDTANISDRGFFGRSGSPEGETAMEEEEAPSSLQGEEQPLSGIAPRGEQPGDLPKVSERAAGGMADAVDDSAADPDGARPAASGRGTLSDLIRSAARGARYGSRDDADGDEVVEESRTADPAKAASEDAAEDAVDSGHTVEPANGPEDASEQPADEDVASDDARLGRAAGDAESARSDGGVVDLDALASGNAGVGSAGGETEPALGDDADLSAHEGEPQPPEQVVTAPVRAPAASTSVRTGEMVQVRQRTSKRRTNRIADPGGQNDGVAGTTPSGLARADAVRDKLTRFTQAVSIGREAASVETSDEAQERAVAVRQGLSAFADGIERGRAEAKDEPPEGDE